MYLISKHKFWASFVLLPIIWTLVDLARGNLVASDTFTYCYTSIFLSLLVWWDTYYLSSPELVAILELAKDRIAAREYLKKIGARFYE